LEPIFIPDKEQEALKSIARRRYQIRKRTTQIKNRIKQFLHNRGIQMPEKSETSHWSGKFMHWLDTLQVEQKFDRYYLDSQLIDLKNERAQMLSTLKQIRTYSKDNPTITYLKTINGIGPITAFTFYAEICDMKRFKNLDKIASFLGLVPDTDSTGDDETITGITKRYQKYLRYLLVEAAWIAVRKDPALTLAYANLRKRKSAQKAIIKITKKLVNRMRYVWLNQTEYIPAVVK
jgi:transposase